MEETVGMQNSEAQGAGKEMQRTQVAMPSSTLNAEKAFWVLVIAVVAGFFLFLAFGGLVAPVSAAVQQGGNAFQPPSGGGLLAAQPSPAPTGGELAPVKNGVQEITLTVQGGTYYPSPIRVKKGVPVKITADLSSVRGCASSIVIPEFGVRKVVRQGDNAIEFTPGKSGTFGFSCSMGMYRGTIVVEESDGTVANFKGAAPVAAAGAGGASCGAGGGGCGCGG